MCTTRSRTCIEGAAYYIRSAVVLRMHHLFPQCHLLLPYSDKNTLNGNLFILFYDYFHIYSPMSIHHIYAA